MLKWSLQTMMSRHYHVIIERNGQYNAFHQGWRTIRVDFIMVPYPLIQQY